MPRDFLKDVKRFTPKHETYKYSKKKKKRYWKPTQQIVRSDTKVRGEQYADGQRGFWMGTIHKDVPKVYDIHDKAKGQFRED